MLLTQVIFKKCQVNKQYTYNGDNLLKWLWISLCFFFFFFWWKIEVVTSSHLTLCVKKLFQWFVCLVHAFECSFTYPGCLLFSEYLICGSSYMIGEFLLEWLYRIWSRRRQIRAVYFCSCLLQFWMRKLPYAFSTLVICGSFCDFMGYAWFE